MIGDSNELFERKRYKLKMSANLTKWLWLVFLFGGPFIVVIGIQQVAKTPLNTSLNSAAASSFLATVAQVLAGILAIVFSVSVLAVDIAADKYTPRLFSYFAKNWATQLSFVSILALIILSVVAMGVQDIPMSQWRYLSMTGLFAFCLLTLPYYFYQTLQLLDPRNLAERIRNEGLRSLKKQDQQKTLDAITSLGDIAIKALGRGEDEITKRYLDALQEIEHNLIRPNSASIFSNKKSLASALWGFGIRSPIFDQYYRVFKAAVTIRNEEITSHVVGYLNDTISNITARNHNTEFLKGRLQQYQDFVKIAIENKDHSRFALTHSLRNTIIPRFHPGAYFNDDYLPILRGAIVQANKEMIDNQDFELWKEELRYFSSIISIEDIYISLSNNLRELILQNKFLHEKWVVWEWMEAVLQTRITSTNRRAFEMGISEIEEMIPPSNQELHAKLLEVKNLLYDLWATTFVYDAFFTACVYAYYRKQFGYIKELWRHVNPKDASAHWGNTNLIRFDVGFLTYQMYYHVLLPWKIEDYHGSEAYVFRYYLLCLAYTFLHTHSDWHPTTSFLFKPLLDQDNKELEIMRAELQAAYTFLMNLPYYADEVLAQYDVVASEKEEWEDMFDGKTSDALEKVRDWLTDVQRRQEWTSKAEGIIRDLPLDNRRIEAYRKSALEYYKEESQIKYLAIQAESSDRQNSIELTGRWNSQKADKRRFTLIDLNEPERISVGVGFGAVHNLVRSEISHITKTLLAEKEQKTIPIDGLDFDRILKSVEKIKLAGHTATVLIAPDQAIASAWQKDYRFKVNMRYENQERYLQVDPNTKLKIIELPGDYVFIFSKHVGIWTTIDPPMIEVRECSKNPRSVEIFATETVKYQVPNPQAVEILKFNQQKDTQ
jgi:hypothetical protein